MPRVRIRFIVPALAVLLIAGSPAATAQQPAVLRGLLVAENPEEERDTSKGKDRRVNLEGAVVYLLREGSRKGISLTADKRGRFGRVGVQPGVYSVAVECRGFVSLSVGGVEVRNNAQVDLVLRLTRLEQ
jgi:hypothetical protein